jgi:hypothetical protein
MAWWLLGQTCLSQALREGGAFVRKPQGHSEGRFCRAKTRPVDLNRPRDVLERRFSDVLETNVEFPLSILVHATRNADAPWLGEALKASCAVHTITKKYRLCR